MTWDEKKKDRLDRFLLEHQPESPSAPVGEESRIRATIDSARSESTWRLFEGIRGWMLPAAVAALIAVVVIFVTREPIPTSDVTASVDAATVVIEAYDEVQGWEDIDEELLASEYVWLAEQLEK